MDNNNNNKTADFSFMEALEATGTRQEIANISEKIQNQIHRVEKSMNLEKVNFDVKRSALAKAVLAVETSLYDRKVLEDELLSWASKYSSDHHHHYHYQSSSNNNEQHYNSHHRQQQKYDDNRDIDDHDDDSSCCSSSSASSFDTSDEEDIALVSNALSANSSTLGDIMNSAENQQARKEQKRFDVDEFVKMGTAKRRRRWKERKNFITSSSGHHDGEDGTSHNNFQQQQYYRQENKDLMKMAKKRLQEHEQEEGLDPVYELLQQKEQQVGKATTALSVFSKRILAMYRAFLKIYGSESAGQNAIAVKIFEGETLRQLHLMETATNEKQTQSISEQQQSLHLQQQRANMNNKSINVQAMKKQLSQMKENVSKINREKLKHEDTIREQSDRIDVLELACRELTKTTHQLRGEVRQFEEAEARRVVARRQQQQYGNNNNNHDQVGDAAIVYDENGFPIRSPSMYSRSSMISEGGYYGSKRDSYLSSSNQNNNNSTHHHHHKSVTFGGPNNNYSQNNNSNSNNHRQCKLILRVLASKVKDLKKENEKLKARIIWISTNKSSNNDISSRKNSDGSNNTNNNDDDDQSEFGVTALLKRMRSSKSFFTENKEQETQYDRQDYLSMMAMTSTTDTKSNDEKHQDIVDDPFSKSVQTSNKGVKFDPLSSSSTSLSPSSSAAMNLAASKRRRNNSSKKTNDGIRTLHHLKKDNYNAENELHTLETDADFFNALADALTMAATLLMMTSSSSSDPNNSNNNNNDENARSAALFLPKVLKILIQILDSYLLVAPSSSSNNNNNNNMTLSNTLKQSIMRVRDYFDRQRIQLLQQSGKNSIAQQKLMMSSSTSAAKFSSPTSSSKGNNFGNNSGSPVLSSSSIRRPPPSPSTNPHVSDSAINSYRLPNNSEAEENNRERLRRMLVLSNNNTTSNNSNNTLHPDIDQKMADAYESSIMTSRENIISSIRNPKNISTTTTTTTTNKTKQKIQSTTTFHQPQRPSSARVFGTQLQKEKDKLKLEGSKAVLQTSRFPDRDV